VGALGHYLELEGIPTTQVSLVREHTVALAPPRALWVPFMLGRPFGVPNDPGFQRKVLLAALTLLERVDTPLIEDFPEDAPHDDLGAAPEGLVCPVSFPRLETQGALTDRLVNEVGQLRAWHELAVNQRGRTTLGTTGLSPEELACFIASWTTEQPRSTFRQGLASAAAIKLACDELKAYYYEAKSMQPGRHPSGEMQRWFWQDTAAGQAFLAIRDRAATSVDPAMQPIATLSLVPRAVDAALRSAG